MRDYSNMDIFSEEAVNIDHHLPAMVVSFKGRKPPRIRIIPSKKYKNPAHIEGFAATIVHETIHIWLWRNFGLLTSSALDNLPFPRTLDEFYSGVYGWKDKEDTKVVKPV